MDKSLSPVARIAALLREEKSDITPIYFYAIFNGLIQLSLPVGIQAIIGFVLAGTMRASLVLLISLIVLGVLLVGILQMAQKKIIEKIQQRIFVRYAYAFVDRIPRLDLKKVDSYYLPELVNRFFDTVALQKSLSKLLLDLPAAVIQILFGLMLLAFYHPAFIMFGVILVLLLWAILYFTGTKGLETSLTESQHKYSVASWFEEMARVVRSFKFSTGSDLHLRKANERTIQYLDARTQHFHILLVQFRTLVGFKVLITAAMLIVGVILLLEQQINIGQFVAAEIIIVTVIASVEKIIGNLDSVYDALTSVDKINKLLDKPVEKSGSLLLEGRGGLSVRAENLSFGYGDRKVLQQVDFRLEPGEKACITGPNGSGKSTLLKLLTGGYTDIGGALLLNDVPIGNYQLDSVRAQIGIFFLNETVFQGSLYENLTMGRDTDRAWLNELVQLCGLGPFLNSLPTGYDTELDPTGKRLPTNVMQKILFIRAVVHRPRLLLLEEPWRGIEEPYCSQIRDLLFSLNDTTVIISTNDKDFIARADRDIRLTNN